MANTHSIDLNGSSQYLTITDAAQTGLDLSGDFTFECWVNLDSLGSGQQSLIYKRAAGQLSYEWYYSDAGGGNINYRCGIFNGTSDLNVGVTTAISTSTTYHLAVTRSGSTVKFYVDGSQVGTDQTMSGTINNSTATVQIGGRNTGEINGRIDDFRVWTVARTQAEIDANKSTELTGSESNLVAYWKFNNNATDETSNANDLTANGSPTYTTGLFVDGGGGGGDTSRNLALMGVGL